MRACFRKNVSFAEEQNSLESTSGNEKLPGENDLLVATVGPSYLQVTDRHDKLHDQHAA